MQWYVRMVVMITFFGASWGVLVVGPKFVRSNQNYTVVVSNFDQATSRVILMLRLEAKDDEERNVFTISKVFDVRRNMNRIVTLDIPTITTPINVKLKIDGQRGFNFHEEEILVYLSKSISGLVQIDKPVFKPGDTVKFRVIVLDTELKPPAQVKTARVTIRDHQENVIREWSSAKLYAGVFESDLQIGPTPMIGMCTISVRVGGEELVSKTFEVKEYVLPSFDVEVIPSVIPLVEHQNLTLTIAANYHFGKPVKGLAKVELYLEDDAFDQKKEFEMDGMRQIELRFKKELELYDDQQDVRVKTTFIEQFTGRTVTKEKAVSIYKYLYRATLHKDCKQFRPGFSWKCILKLNYHDGSAARNVPLSVLVETDSGENERMYTTDKQGEIKLVINSTESTEQMDVTFRELESGFSLTEQIYKVETFTNTFIKLEMKLPIKLNHIIRLSATSNERMTFFVYYVVSKGIIQDAGFIRPNGRKKYNFQINASEKMIPKAKIVVATVSNAAVIWDALDVDLKQLGNHLEITIEETEVKPGNEIELQLKGRPSAYVALAAYDKALLQFSSKHDLFWDDVMQVFDAFHAVKQDEYHVFYSMGLFAIISGGTKLEPVHTASKRFGSNIMRPTSNLVPYRTNFLESWLWKNVTIGSGGKCTMTEVVPETTTSWYLTGFSIDPVYGLGIIKKPIQFTTVQPFYIVDNLPYSIKRGEAVVLQFTLFHNLGGEYIADVTLYNVANQMEFVGRPLEDLTYTKSVSVPPKAGAPISFLVRARKLGEMAVRVKATIMNGRESDALEKVIRVMPENIILHDSVPRFFSLDKYGTEEFKIQLDILKQANFSAIKLEFILSSNLLTPVVNNLDNLLTVPTASGAPSMINFIPNLVVLEYLRAISSNETDLINKATGLLRNGYQNEMQYRQRDGSFGNWRNSTGSIFVTALVAKSMESASKYIEEVDSNMVYQLFDWLASKQDSSGRFDETAPITYQSLQGGSRNGIALTSYVLIAFLENNNVSKNHQEVVQKGVQYVANHLSNIIDVYDLSLATYALVLNDHSLKSKALDSLVAQSCSVQGPYGDERYWPSDTASIETTAYALLSLVHVKRYTDGISVMRWLVNQREASGSFPRTQDTFVGLKAVTMLANAVSPMNNDYSIIVQYGQTRKEYKLTSMEVNQVSRHELMENAKIVTVSVHGRGFGLFEIAYQYGIDVRNINKHFNLSVEPQFSNAGYTLQLNVCITFTPKLAHTRSNLALVEANFPSGYVIKGDSVLDTTNRNPFKNVEFLHGYTSVVIYYDSLGAEENCFTVTAERRFRVAFLRPAYVLVHDSYDTQFRAVREYEVLQDTCVNCN